MTRKAKLIAKEQLHKGYLQLYKYDLVIPSLSLKKNDIHRKNHEVVQSSDSILVLIYLPKLDSFLLCQQFRIGVFFNPSRDNPFILECVAGTIDKNGDPQETARREVYEETGLEINTLKTIAIVYKSPGLMTEKAYIYYAEVKETPKIGIYGVEDEEIMTHLISRKNMYQLLDEMKIMDAASLIALNWFRAQQAASISLPTSL